MNLNIPNILTLFRIALIPVFVVVFFMPLFGYNHIILAAIYFIAGITDWFDGYLARRLNQLSAFGAFLDPVADKLMVTVALVLIVSAHPGALVAIPAAVIVGREITVSALREWMVNIGNQTMVKVSLIGKVKTATQMWAVGFILFEKPLGFFPTLEFGYLLLYISAALTLWSMIVYLIAAWPTLNAKD